jgi:hypothetical protein
MLTLFSTTKHILEHYAHIHFLQKFFQNFIWLFEIGHTKNVQFRKVKTLYGIFFYKFCLVVGSHY